VEPTSRALDLVRRARRRATLSRASRAVLSGVGVGALLAAAAAAGAFALGIPVGAWLGFAGLVVVPVVGIRLRRARPSLPSAALLLDRAAGTRERFVAAIGTADPEVRDLVARQALADPAFAGGRFPLTFPPSREGLAAVISVALLAAVLFLGPELTRRSGPAPVGGTAAVPGTPGVGSPGEVEGGAAPPTPPGPSAVTKPIAERILEGDDLTEGDWRDLSTAGLTEAERDAIRAALESGDRESAAKAARAALDRVAALAEPSPGAVGGDWGAYERSLSTPGWHPRFDRAIRDYFKATGQRGLR